MTTLEQLFELVGGKIQEALNTRSVAIFVRDDKSGDYVCVISSPELPSRPRLSFDAFTVRRLKRLSGPLTLHTQEFDTWKLALASADLSLQEARRREIETLGELESALLVQITMKDELVAILSVGPRPGDEPFFDQDKRMLMAIGDQMAFIIENAKLVQRIAEQERLRRELEMATEVQRRLFPERPPEVGALELAGFCQPARGVGGDYYDFLELDGGQIGIALADVAGKGISAALLMSVVQASLRSLVGTGGSSLAAVVSKMNRLMHRSTDTSSYATFFYAQFDPETRLLTYVNAGHNPPFLLKASGKETEAPRIIRLSGGGPVIGILSDWAYEQETIQMHCGDLLVPYTDGVTEALDSTEEEFGEERLQTILMRSMHLSANEVSEAILASVRDWIGDAPQHDDLTFIVLKVKTGTSRLFSLVAQASF